jgi:hypothetical protein
VVCLSSTYPLKESELFFDSRLGGRETSCAGTTRTHRDGNPGMINPNFCNLYVGIIHLPFSDWECYDSMMYKFNARLLITAVISGILSIPVTVTPF